MATRKKTAVKTQKSQETKDKSIEPENVGKDLNESKQIVNSLDDFSDIFVDESNTFDVSIRIYRDKDGRILVEDVDAMFDENNSNIKEFNVTFKMPSYADQEAITSTFKDLDLTKLTVSQFVQLEENRVFQLIRSWDLPSSVNNISKVNPKIIKALCSKVREKIEYSGIL